jgi:hypothetical protein
MTFQFQHIHICVLNNKPHEDRQIKVRYSHTKEHEITWLLGGVPSWWRRRLGSKGYKRVASNQLKETKRGNSNSTSERREREEELTRRSYIVEFRRTRWNKYKYNREAERAEREVIPGNPSRCERRQVGDDHNNIIAGIDPASLWIEEKAKIPRIQLTSEEPAPQRPKTAYPATQNNLKPL